MRSFAGIIQWIVRCVWSAVIVATLHGCYGGDSRPSASAAAAAANPGTSALTFEIAINRQVEWPPRLSKRYPDLVLQSSTGDYVQLSSLRGQVLLIEPIGMSCPACQAFAGAHRYGSFQGFTPQQNLRSIDEYFQEYTDVSLDDERIVHVHLLLYGPKLGVPTLDEARAWAKHFRTEESANRIVLLGTKELQTRASYDMVPGFQLVDKAFMLRYDSTGHRPRHNLYTELLPAVAMLVNARGPMAISEAYRAIPHRQTTFRSQGARLDDGSKAFLHRFFTLVDHAMVARVATLRYFQSRGRRGQPFEQYQTEIDSVLKELRRLNAPASLQKAHRLVVEAIEAQGRYFADWNASGVRQHFDYQPGPTMRQHEAIRASSSRLHQAYAEIMRVCGQKDSGNKNAYFDHLCALDFI